MLMKSPNYGISKSSPYQILVCYNNSFIEMYFQFLMFACFRAFFPLFLHFLGYNWYEKFLWYNYALMGIKSRISVAGNDTLLIEPQPLTYFRQVNLSFLERLLHLRVLRWALDNGGLKSSTGWKWSLGSKEPIRIVKLQNCGQTYMYKGWHSTMVAFTLPDPAAGVRFRASPGLIDRAAA